MCERISTTQICTRISSCLLLHQCDIPRYAFPQAKSHFNVPPTRIQLGHLSQREHLRITDIGEIHAYADPIAQAHQPNQVTRLPSFRSPTR